MVHGEIGAATIPCAIGDIVGCFFTARGAHAKMDKTLFVESHVRKLGSVADSHIW